MMRVKSGASSRLWVAGAALCLLSGLAKADLTCRPISLAEKEPIVMRLCVDALGEEMIVVFNEHRGLDATPLIAGCALSFADGKKKIARWRQETIGPGEQSRQRAPLKGMPSPIDAICEIEKVTLSSKFADDNEGVALRSDAGSLVGSSVRAGRPAKPRRDPAAIPYTIPINPRGLSEQERAVLPPLERRRSQSE